MDPRVFISSEPAGRADRDFSSAQRYGSVHFVLPVHPAPAVAPGPALLIAQRVLKDFDHERDFIAFGGGDPAGMFILGAVLANMGFPHVNLLRWERERDTDGSRKVGSGFYLPSRVPLRVVANPSRERIKDV